MGCFPGEQELTQEVSFSLAILKDELPRACFTDQLKDTICYYEICNEIKKIVLQKNFSTIEHLTWSVFSNLKETISPSNKINLKVKKVKPPIVELANGVEFQISEFSL